MIIWITLKSHIFLSFDNFSLLDVPAYPLGCLGRVKEEHEKNGWRVKK